MVNRTALGLIALVVAALLLPATALALVFRGRASAKTSPANGRMPASSTSTGVPEVGALYSSSSAPRHTCTASVVQSPAGNTLITAAHCVAGKGAGMMFIPDQRGTQAPYGRWVVTGTYVESQWLLGQNPDADVAFLTVAPKTFNGARREIEQVTGAYKLGSTAVSGHRVTITGYPAGSTDDPITCTTKVYLEDAFPSFNCRGFVDGTSGSPWLRATGQGSEIVGVIGGLDQGGCSANTSYSSPLTEEVHIAYVRASDDAPADVAPHAGSDGCG